MTVELERPDLELRRNVLKLKAEQDGLSLPQEVMDFIAENVTESVRELEGIVVSLLAHATVMNKEITLDLARHVMANVVKMHRKTINFEMITQGVASHYNIDPESISQNHANARFRMQDRWLCIWPRNMPRCH